MSEAILRLEQVTKSFPSGAGRLDVLRSASLEVRGREAVAIVGRSGSGKSTLLHLCAALDRPDSGSIVVAGLDVASLDPEGAALLRREKVGLVFQSPRLLPYCTALENVLVPTVAWTDEVAKRSAPARARKLLDLLGIGARGDHLPSKLSGGEAQRVAIARALLAAPRVVLADEPTGALDDATAAQVVEVLLHACRSEEAALVVVTHAEGVAHAMDRVVELSAGTLHGRGK